MQRYETILTALFSVASRCCVDSSSELRLVDIRMLSIPVASCHVEFSAWDETYSPCWQCGSFVPVKFRRFIWHLDSPLGGILACSDCAKVKHTYDVIISDWFPYCGRNCKVSNHCYRTPWTIAINCLRGTNIFIKFIKIRTAWLMLASLTLCNRVSKSTLANLTVFNCAAALPKA